MTTPANEPFPRRKPRRLPLFWDRAAGDGRPCRSKDCGWVMYIWADGKGFVWQMCRRCDTGAGS